MRLGTGKRRAVGRAAALVLVAAAHAAHAASVPPVSFDAVDRTAFLRRHAFSLDHFLEFEPGGLVVRLGPIGNDASYSRWGIGRGRARLIVNGIPMNDPQNDLAPFVHTATSGIARIELGSGGALRSYATGIEGSVVVEELEAPESRPQTFLELSKGDNDLRQRRVRFASQEGRAGLVLSYDEVLDDGYAFDASGEVGQNVPGYGESRSRNASIAVRGGGPGGERYSFGLRRYRSSTTGDLSDAASEADRSGHLAWMSVALAGASVTLYGRGYASSHPDSQSVNEAGGAVLAWEVARAQGASLSFAASAEHINATQDIAGAEAKNDVTKAAATAEATWRAGEATTWFAHATAAGDERSPAWGAGGGVTREISSGLVRATARRTFRLPSIGERYLPAHARDGRVLVGRSDLDPEDAVEVGGDWVLRAGGFTNRVRAAWVRADGTIAFRPVDGDTIRRAENAAEGAAMTFLEERLGLEAGVGPLSLRGAAGVLYTTGDRVEAFASVPGTQFTASLVAGSELFEKSSALYAGAEYTFVDDRVDYRGNSLPSYHVVNLILEGRLIDARLYLRWLNVLDEQYQTEGGYLMTPATFVYGIEWTLFD